MASNRTSDPDSAQLGTSPSPFASFPAQAAPVAPLAVPSRTPQQGEQPAPPDADLSVGARWERARQKMAADAIVETRASGFNKGGLLVAWLDLPGFLPASQLLGLDRLHLEQERLRHLQERQHAPLRLKIIEIDQDANHLIFSERATQTAAPQRERLLGQLAVGEKRTGTITNLADFGAFVDLGGVEGLIHLSELSWRRLKHPSDVVHPGESVEVIVLSVDEARERIGLSRKRLYPDPWPGVEERYRRGQVVEGRVSSLTSFGAFVLVERELEGLLHVSEFADEMEALPAAVFERGDPVRASVLQVSEKKRRLGLSLRRMEQN